MVITHCIRSFMAVAIASTIAGSAHAQSSACVALIQQGIRDTSSVDISEARFNEIKANVCNSNYDSYSKASSQAANGGFDIAGIFGISAGGSNANSEYSTKWSNFCQADYSKAISNSELHSYVATANQNILHSFDNCVKVTSEQFVRYIEPQPDGKTFSIVFKNKREGTTSFQIYKITLTDATSGTLLSVKDNCDFDRPFPFDTKPINAFSIVCRKKAEDSVVVSGITDAGNIDPVAVPAVPLPGPGISDRIATLEGEAQQLQGSIAQLSNRLDASTNTLTPRVDLLDKKAAAIYQALSFGSGQITRKNGVVYNGCDTDSPGCPRCPNGSVMTGVRHSGYNYENGEMDCVSLKPVDVH